MGAVSEGVDSRNSGLSGFQEEIDKQRAVSQKGQLSEHTQLLRLIHAILIGRLTSFPPNAVPVTSKTTTVPTTIHPINRIHARPTPTPAPTPADGRLLAAPLAEEVNEPPRSGMMDGEPINGMIEENRERRSLGWWINQG